MPAIATAGWVARFGDTLAGVDAGPIEVDVLHRLTGGAAWRISAAGGRVRVTIAAPDEAADLTFTWEPDDAEAVARGDYGPLVPFQAGRLRVGGDLTRLAEVADLFARFPAIGGAPDGA